MEDTKPQHIVKTVKNYSKGLYGFIRDRVKTNEDAEDILQDVWVQLSNVDDTSTIDQLIGWLHKVARTKIIDRYRKKSPDALASLQFNDDDTDFDLSDILLADDDDPEAIYLKETFWEELFIALDELPENQRQVFVWNELEDKTLQQIADETGEKLKTIISRKGYAVKYLRNRLEELYHEFMDY